MSKIQVVFEFVAANEKVDFSAVKYRLYNNNVKEGITWGDSTQALVEDSSIEKLVQTVVIDTTKASIADVETIAAIHKKDIKSTTVVSNEPYVEAKVVVEEKTAVTGKSVAVFDLYALYEGVDFAPVAKAVLEIKKEGVVFTKTDIVDVFDGQKLVVTAEIDNSKTSAAEVEKLFSFPDEVDGINLVSETAVAEAPAGKVVAVFDLYALYEGVDFAPVAKAVLEIKKEGVVFTKTDIVDVFDGQKLVVTAEVDKSKTSVAEVEKLFSFPDDVDGINLVSETPL